MFFLVPNNILYAIFQKNHLLNHKFVLGIPKHQVYEQDFMIKRVKTFFLKKIIEINLALSLISISESHCFWYVGMKIALRSIAKRHR